MVNTNLTNVFFVEIDECSNAKIRKDELNVLEFGAGKLSFML